MSTNHESGWVYEIFSSIQGEGLYCGCRQTFVRFAGCNLSCGYCDTPAASGPKPQACKMQRFPGSDAFDEIPNPITVEAVVNACKKLGSQDISITGGEPLLQAGFLRELAMELKQSSFNIHLETNGTLSDKLQQVSDLIDVIAMDIKLPSATNESACWDEHKGFLRAAQGTKTFVKVVVSPDTKIEEIANCAGLIAEINTNIPLIIQPVTGTVSVPGTLLMKLQESALKKLDDVRVIPQCHKALGLL